MTAESSSLSMTTDLLTTTQRQALTAYLEPLCQKHEKGETITYEDLIASKQAADSVAKEETAATKVVHELHASQIAAYRTAATHALQEWARQWTHLPEPQPQECWSEYRERWWTAASTAPVPAWKVDNKDAVIKPILQGRALALFNAKRKELKAEPKKEKSDGNDTAESSLGDKLDETEKLDDIEEGEEEEGGEEEEEGEQEEEDGEIEEEDGEVEEEEEGEMEEGEEGEEEAAEATPKTANRQQQQAPSSTRKTRSKAKNNKANNAGGTKQAPRKKALPNKPLGQSKTVRGNARKGGRRGGRAGGGNK